MQREVQKRLAARQADGDALLGLVIDEAFSDVRQLFDHNGAMLKPQDWPDSIVNCIEGVEVREDRIRVKLTSKAQARRFLLEVLGRTRSTADSIDHLAEAILADRAKHLPGEIRAKRAEDCRDQCRAPGISALPTWAVAIATDVSLIQLISRRRNLRALED